MRRMDSVVSDIPGVFHEVEGMERAKGLLYVSFVKGAFIFSGSIGVGVFVKKLEEGKWSGPISVLLFGGGAGMQVGLHKTDMLAVFTSEHSIHVFESHGQLHLGGEYAIAIGPIGMNLKADAIANRKGVTAEGGFHASKGLFFGISLDGALIVTNSLANHAYYGRSDAKLKEILSGRITVPDKHKPIHDRLVEHLTRIQEGDERRPGEVYADPNRVVPVDDSGNIANPVPCSFNDTKVLDPDSESDSEAVILKVSDSDDDSISDSEAVTNTTVDDSIDWSTRPVNPVVGNSVAESVPVWGRVQNQADGWGGQKH
eukprot:CAMPEP_0203760816 /NCGR_PEP_ID=MMETSP0098-20131031/14021_1 /ASSEMBLY_ACC=CAM_ASM_000208 /TAXON_ID=96639 /ORGANISM=" , Strain NY0313808BC1" /LENGTH=313 /DNA_ID=CAMNT_0050654535 /DNA_START=321 /DNA_END=1262 /DNA_ORIENTATION=+